MLCIAGDVDVWIMYRTNGARATCLVLPPSGFLFWGYQIYMRRGPQGPDLVEPCCFLTSMSNSFTLALFSVSAECLRKRPTRFPPTRKSVLVLRVWYQPHMLLWQLYYCPFSKSTLFMPHAGGEPGDTKEKKIRPARLITMVTAMKVILMWGWCVSLNAEDRRTVSLGFI